MRRDALRAARVPLVVLLAAGAIAGAQELPRALQSSLEAVPAERAIVQRRQAQLNAMSAAQRQAFAQRVAAWDALSPEAQAPRRDAWLAWQALPQAQRLRMQAAADAYAALPQERQLALRQAFDALDTSERRGWLLGPELGRDYPRLQSLLAQVPAAQRDGLVAVLRAMPARERGDLAVLAQRTPPQERDALRRALLSTTATNRATWLQARLDR